MSNTPTPSPEPTAEDSRLALKWIDILGVRADVMQGLCDADADELAQDFATIRTEGYADGFAAGRARMQEKAAQVIECQEDWEDGLVRRVLDALLTNIRALPLLQEPAPTEQEDDSMDGEPPYFSEGVDSREAMAYRERQDDAGYHQIYEQEDER